MSALEHIRGSLERGSVEEALALLDEACSAVRIEAAERTGRPEKPAGRHVHYGPGRSHPIR